MSNESTLPAEVKPKRRGRGILSAVAYFAGVAVLVFAVSLLSPPESPSVDVTAADTTATTAAEPVLVEAPSFVSGEEPIADAAEIILPSVVHIQTSTGIGSGVIYDSSGLIVTAAHVVGEEETVRIRLDSGDQIDGKVLGAVTDVDIAVIEIDMDGLPAASFDLGKPRVGQLAIAIGSPWGLESTVTAGIISAVDQASCAFGSCFSMVQTDAAINPGNSGGPLVDRHGQVVGLNVSIFSESGANDGVGFAVPADVVMDYADSIVSGEPLETAFLGVKGEFATEEGQAGALITEVFVGTGAADADVRVGDIVVSIDGVEVSGIDDLAAQVRVHKPGEVVEMTLVRSGDELTVLVTLGVRSDDLS